MRQFRLIWVAVGMLFLPFAAMAQGLRLDECQRLAQENYPLLKKYDLIRQTTDFTVSNLNKGYLPQLSLGGQASYQSDVMTLPSALTDMLASSGYDVKGLEKDQYKVSLDLNQVIYDGGNIRAGKAVAQAEGEADSRQTDVDMYALRDRVNNLFFGILLTEDKLRLNEDLTEAIALGHDLGHTPFGHAGERLLNSIVPGGFAHFRQSLRVVDRLEKGGEGLNLCYEVRRGILCHTGHDRAETLEGQIVRLADKIAYINHDIDDAMRGGIIYPMDIPLDVSQVLGFDHGDRINTLTGDVIQASQGKGEICQSPACGQAMTKLRNFMFEAVYRNPVAKGEESKAQDMIARLFEYYQRNPDELPPDYQDIRVREGIDRAVCDYIAGMTDHYAVAKYSEAYIPLAWSVK